MDNSTNSVLIKIYFCTFSKRVIVFYLSNSILYYFLKCLSGNFSYILCPAYEKIVIFECYSVFFIRNACYQNPGKIYILLNTKTSICGYVMYSAL